VLQNKTDIPRGKFKTPFINGGLVMPILLAGTIVLLATSYRNETMSFIQNKPTIKTSEEMLLQLNESQMEKLKEFTKIEAYRLVSKLPEGKSGLSQQKEVNLEEFFAVEKGAEILQSQIKLNNWKNIETQNEGWSHFANKIPSWIFILFTIFITIMAVRNKLSLIPILGLLSCLYMMSQLALANWIYFTIWLLLGLVIYFLYGRKHSKLAHV
jgi:hypothetical protein